MPWFYFHDLNLNRLLSRKQNAVQDLISDFQTSKFNTFYFLLLLLFIHSAPFFPPILLIPHLLIPLHFPMTNRLMNHVTLIISPMPMHRARRTPNNIPNINPLRFPSLVTNPSRPGHHSQQLPSFMVVPVRPGTGRKIHISNRHTIRGEDGVDPDVTPRERS